jgi:hypothetical protein
MTEAMPDRGHRFDAANAASSSVEARAEGEA